MARRTLDDILNGPDPLGLLKDEGSAHSEAQADDLLASLESVNAFYSAHGRIPALSPEAQSPTEANLAIKLKRLSSLRPRDIARLSAHDVHGLLRQSTGPARRLDDILDQCEDILGDEAGGHIFTYRHVAPAKAQPDIVAGRIQCADFEKFRSLFAQCHAGLSSGTYKTRRFKNEQEITAGDVFVLKGLLAYVAEVNDPHIRGTGSGRKRNARLRVVFENGTESDHLLRSLARELYKDPTGRRIVRESAGPLFGKIPETSDTQTGSIYVLRSLSQDPRLKALEGRLHKIGMTTMDLHARIQNAVNDPTFLMAPVEPIKSYTLYNIKQSAIEVLLHKFFARARLDICLNCDGKPVQPREWFVVPLDAIDGAIGRLQEGTLHKHVYDPHMSRIVAR
jgi:hypothetical protein